jgi:hypothetical protein
VQEEEMSRRQSKEMIGADGFDEGWLAQVHHPEINISMLAHNVGNDRLIICEFAL